jgi:endonuclease-3
MDKYQKLDHIFSILSETIINPESELQYINEFTFLVAIILSAQTTDILVNKATKKLFEVADSPQKFLELGVEGLSQYISTINLYPTKAKNIIKTSEILVEKFNSKVPDNFDDLILLPGVGRKTANVFLNNLHGHHVIAVDTHVARVANRIGICETSNPLKVEQELEKNTPKKWLRDAHNWLVLHGRYVCKAKKPNCDQCKIQIYCDFYQNIKNQ